MPRIESVDLARKECAVLDGKELKLLKWDENSTFTIKGTDVSVRKFFENKTAPSGYQFVFRYTAGEPGILLSGEIRRTQ